MGRLKSMPLLERPNAKINYEVWGEGNTNTITLLNGFTRTLMDFRTMGRTLVNRGWRVIAIDNRGAGISETTGGFTLQDSADDVMAIWDQLTCQRSYLLGISYGGLLAMVTALRTPERVKGLVLVSTTGTWATLKIKTEAATPRRWDPDESFLKYFSPTFIAGHRVLVRSLAKEMAKAFQDPILLQKAQSQRNAMNGFDLSGQVGQLKMPVLILHGGEDKIVDIGAAGDLARQIPHAKFEVFEGAGHLLLAETPRRFYETVSTFCEGLEGTDFVSK
jgi:pimeloyl-ACP methyl ester carboxylesterase